MVEAHCGGCQPRMSIQGHPIVVEQPEQAAAMSSGKTSRSSLVVPVGWRAMASAVLCRTPGMCTIRNR